MTNRATMRVVSMNPWDLVAMDYVGYQTYRRIKGYYPAAGVLN